MGLVAIELAPTGRAKCVDCMRKILKNTPRGIINGRDDYNREVKSFICHKCALEMLDEEIKSRKYMKTGLKRLTKKNMKEVILMELEDNGKH